MKLLTRKKQSERGRIAFQKRTSGVALITAMMILALVSTLAIAAIQTSGRDQQVAGVQARSRVAFQAAEAGLATALSTVGTGAPVLVGAAFGDATAHNGGQPSYRLDPNVATPVANLGATPMPGMSLNVNGNGPKFQMQLWRINVEGSEPNGMTARVEAASAALWGK